MKVVSTFHPSSSVTSSLKCTLTPDDELGHLVVSRTNRIEVSAITPVGLKHECSLEVWGRVLSLKAVPAHHPAASNLLVLLDHPHPRLLLLQYKNEFDLAVLQTVWSSDLRDRHARHSEFFTDIVTNVFGDVAVVSCYTGKLKVICFNGGRVVNDFDVILPELNLLSLTFMETDSTTHTLAILHIDHLQRVQLLARDLDIDGLELSVVPSCYLQCAILPSSSFPDTENPLILVPMASFKLGLPRSEDAKEAYCRGGVLVVGGRKIIFVEAASVDEQNHQKGKEKRQRQRKASTSEKAHRQAVQRDKEREAKKVKSRATVKWPWSEITAWCPADHDCRRFFLGDMFGRLGLLTITDTCELILLPVGEISAPTTLSYLSSQVLFVGSHTGDSQVVKLHATPQIGLDQDTLPIPNNLSKISPTSLSEEASNFPAQDEDIEMEGVGDARPGKGGKIVALKGIYVEVLDRFRNLAPILDAVLADTDESGQPQIITCSGGANTGALNIVRTGVDFQEHVILKDLLNVVRVFAIRNSFDEDIDTHILLSTLHESLVLRVDGRNAVARIEPDYTALITDQPTLAAGNVTRRIQRGDKSMYTDSAYVIQVTPKCINLLEYDATLMIFNRIGALWTPPDRDGVHREIVAASLNASQVVAALSGGTVYLLNLGLNGQLNVQKSRDFPGKEISATSCEPLSPAKKYSTYIAISFWESNVVQLLSLRDESKYLEPFCTSPTLPALPCSVILHNFGTGTRSKDPDFRPFVVAGLVDGSVATMSIQSEELRDLKLFSLGTAPVSLGVTHVDGNQTILASGSRAAILYWGKQRLRQSSVMMKDVTIGASLNTAHFRSCQILATSTSLHIGQIRGIDKMQIRSVPFGLENPKRISYHSLHNIFGIICSDVVPHRVGEATVNSSTFNVVDGITFTHFNRFECQHDEEITAVKSLDKSGMPTSAAFCVGIVRAQVGEHEPSLGRLVLFGVEGAERDLVLIASQETDGCVYAIDTVNGLIAAAVNTSVDLYCILREEESTLLSRVARWNHNYFVTSIVAKKDRLIVGDGISSVSVLKVTGHNLECVARDYAPLWPHTVEGVKGNGIIGSNLDCNLFTFSIQETEGRKRLERDGYYHLGDVVTKFLPGGLNVQDTHEVRAVFEAEHIYFTSSGRIGVVLHVNDEAALDLTALQRNMAGVITGPGDVNHARWRTPSNARSGSDAEQSFGFLDGDFLEQFLTYPSSDKLLKGGNRAERLRVEKENVDDMLEKLQTWH